MRSRPLVRQPAPTPPTYSGRAGVLRRRRRAPAPAEQRPGLQHLRCRTRSTWPGSSRSSSRATPARSCSTPTPPERAPVGQQIVARANQSRMDYAPLREAFATTDTDDPVAAGLARSTPPAPEGVASPRRAPRGVGAQELRVQRARRGAQPALRLRRRHPRPGRRRGAVGRGTASCTCRPPPGPARSSRTPGWSARTGGGSPPWTSPARGS